MEVMPEPTGSNDDKLTVNFVLAHEDFLDIELNGVQHHKIYIKDVTDGAVGQKKTV